MEVALLARGDPRPFALTGDWAGGGALVGSNPVRVLEPGEDPFALLDLVPPVEGAGDGAVGGGWFGFLGFGLGAPGEERVPAPPRPVALPSAAFAFHDHVVRLDPEGRWWFEALVTPAREAALEALRAAWERRLGGEEAPRRRAAAGLWRAVPGPGGHAAAVAAARTRVHAGDLFQANLALRLEAALDGELDDLWAGAVERLAPARGAWFSGDGWAVGSLSPEVFLRRSERDVVSEPVKGTRPRPADPGAAAATRAELERSPKDRAENVMIVDLVRNDLGRVCDPGTVAVDELARVRPGPGVWHLVSTVRGRLRVGVGDGELVRACFPPGSVVGAPKLAALAAIAELESTAREAYTGAMGFASPLAGLELNVAIRTLEAAGGRVWLGAGGGVVADSDPAGEADEALAKAAPLLAALGSRPPAPGVPPAFRVPARLGPRPLPRPDPAAGVFETVRARDGLAAQAGAHVARLAASARALYGLELPHDEAAGRLAEAAARIGDGRLRLDARPAAGGLALDVAAGPLPAPALVRLRSVVLPGGLGAHKWRDRRWLDAMAATTPGELPLLVDLDGLVLEAARGSVVAERRDGTLVTPPLDGRILPGTTRARLVASRPVRQEPLALAELEAGWVLGALRGAEPIAALDGRPTASPGRSTPV